MLIPEIVEMVRGHFASAGKVGLSLEVAGQRTMAVEVAAAKHREVIQWTHVPLAGPAPEDVATSCLLGAFAHLMSVSGQVPRVHLHPLNVVPFPTPRRAR